MKRLKQLTTTVLVTVIILSFSAGATALALSMMRDWGSVTEDIENTKSDLLSYKIEQCRMEAEMSEDFLVRNYKVGKFPVQADIARWEYKKDLDCNSMKLEYTVVFQ